MFTVIMSSDEYGAEEFGPYDSATAAALAIERVTACAALLNDGIARHFHRSILTICAIRALILRYA